MTISRLGAESNQVLNQRLSLFDKVDFRQTGFRQRCGHKSPEPGGRAAADRLTTGRDGDTSGSHPDLSESGAFEQRPKLFRIIESEIEIFVFRFQQLPIFD